MTFDQIERLTSTGNLPDGRTYDRLVSTHISWVILCSDRVYKIKKPLKLSFLDFSTLEKREYYCQEEVRLNQRLTEDVYLDIIPIELHGDEVSMGTSNGDVIDYAVEMRRLDNAREMSTLLKDGKVGRRDVEEIADVLSDFHRRTDVIKGKSSVELLIEDFSDIIQICPMLEKEFGEKAGHEFKNGIDRVVSFLNTRSQLILDRDTHGFTRDCHGDLHSDNIVLMDRPVLFDCIEFNEHFRQIDILNEVAFLSMDLDSFGRKDLSDHFIEHYNRLFEIIRTEEERQLFLFYKLYRANVRLKVNALKAEQEVDSTRAMGLVRTYYELYATYLEELMID